MHPEDASRHSASSGSSNTVVVLDAVLHIGVKLSPTQRVDALLDKHLWSLMATEVDQLVQAFRIDDAKRLGGRRPNATAYPRLARWAVATA